MLDTIKHQTVQLKSGINFDTKRLSQTVWCTGRTVRDIAYREGYCFKNIYITLKIGWGVYWVYFIGFISFFTILK